MAIKTYGKVGVSPKGEWNSDTEYKLLNLVSYNGSSYVVKAVNADGIVPVGILPTNTDYYQLSAQGGGVATEDAPGVVKPDGDTIDVDEGGTISVKTATQTTVGIVTGSDDITIASDGKLNVNTNFEQAAELGNIIAGEAINEVFGKVAKSIAALMNLDENAVLKSMLTSQYENSSNTIPTSALLYSLRQDFINLNSNLALKANASDLANVIAQNWSYSELQSNASKSINWSECLFLMFETGNYGNIMESVCIPTDYFATTQPNRRIILTYSGSDLQIYKDSNAAIKVTAKNIFAEQTLQVYGLVRK